MKTNRTIFGMMLLAVVMLCAAGCTKTDNGENGGNGSGNGGGNGANAETPQGGPQVETLAPFSITSSSAKSGGVIADQGDSPITERGICWSTSSSPVVDNTHSVATGNEESFTCTMTGLNPSTTYYVRAYAINTAGVGYGDALSFKTEANGGGGGGNNNDNLPVVETAEVTHVKHTSARCGGNVTADGGSNVTARGICWSRHSEPTLEDNVVRVGSGLGEFSVLLQDLNPTTTYYVRAYATNYTDTNYGEEYSFVTKETPEPAPPAPTGAINGLFSVSPTKQVWFSQGNLQYQASTGTWRFATNSYDFVGGKYKYNSNTTYYYGNISGYNNDISPTNSGWIDLFNWGTSGWNNGNLYYQPYDWQMAFINGNLNQPNVLIGLGYGPTDGINYDYDLTGAYAQADWGVHNAISNGGNQAGLWRTLTSEEWDYLFLERMATTVNGIVDARYAPINIRIGSTNYSGMLLFPDEYTHPEGLAFPNFINYNSTGVVQITNYTISEWAILQEAGCVFLPSAGRRFIETNPNVNTSGIPTFEINYYNSSYGEGHYWTSTSYTNTNQNGVVSGYGSCGFWFSNTYHPGDRIDRTNGYAVRLVQDRQ